MNMKVYVIFLLNMLMKTKTNPGKWNLEVLETRSYK